MKKAPNRPSFIGNYKDLMDEDNAAYPGSSELLSIGSPVGKLLGLQKIGIHIETIPPGRRTSWPHAESTEEEFAYVIKGHPHVWVDGHLHELSAGDFVAFPAGTGIAHTFINNSDEDCVLLVGGERTKEENKISTRPEPAPSKPVALSRKRQSAALIKPIFPATSIPGPVFPANRQAVNCMRLAP